MSQENAKDRRRKLREEQYAATIRGLINDYRQGLVDDIASHSQPINSNCNKNTKYKLVFIAPINNWAIVYEDNSCTILTEGKPHWKIFNKTDYMNPDFTNMHEREQAHIRNQLECAYEVMSS